MRGRVFYNRKKRLLILAILLLISTTTFTYCTNSVFMKKIASVKVSEFLGKNFNVNIGKISGGIFGNMVLENVTISIYGKSNEPGKMFRLERMEISYNVWDIIKEFLNYGFEGRYPLKGVALYFSETNPFLRGFIQIDDMGEGVGIMGYIAPAFLGEDGKKAIKGTLKPNKKGTYDCNFLWNGSFDISGEFNSAGKKLNLVFNDKRDTKKLIKMETYITDENVMETYIRLQQADIFGTICIGDIWFSYKWMREKSNFTVKAKNLVINKNPSWSISIEGSFDWQNEILDFDSVRWGENIIAAGSVDLKNKYNTNISLYIHDLELQDLAYTTGDLDSAKAGKIEGEFMIMGNIKNPEIKGRLFIGEGHMEGMEFRSIFATMEGVYPIVNVVDSRVVKDGGQLSITGYIDFSKINNDKAFDTLIFDTDNKVAVWDKWQITKQEREKIVEATKERFTFSTGIENEDFDWKSWDRDSREKEIGVKYSIDSENSIKMEIEEERDFFGIEHKMQF